MNQKPIGASAHLIHREHARSSLAWTRGLEVFERWIAELRSPSERKSARPYAPRDGRQSKAAMVAD